MTKECFGANPNMHLTCTNMDEQLIITALDKCKAAGIPNILALRGDPPVGQDRWSASDKDFSCASDLVKYIQTHYDDFFSISVAGYPEGHPNAMVEMPADAVSSLSPSELGRYSMDTKTVADGGDEAKEISIINVCSDANWIKEMEYLKSKIDIGGKAVITQMFFDVEVYGRFLQACGDYRIEVPIIPGIMLISNYGGFKRMIKFCKSRVPQTILDRMESLKDDVEGIKQYGIELGIEMCQRLKELGAPGFHFYTLNSSAVTIAVLEGLGFHRVKEVVDMTQAAVELTA
jgi:methylenetetrahydrofolate reductase (NADPH)